MFFEVITETASNDVRTWDSQMAKPLLSAEDLFTLHVTAFNMAENINKAKNLSSLLNSQSRGLWLVLL